ncbi:kinase-like protein [Neoconidiobolus thromboides FSU 785]|nr:kinase-like protein [Neoconidiobolus thromboides FSU 785]
MIREIALNVELGKNPYTIELIDVLESKEKLNLVFEYMSEGDLSKYIEHNKKNINSQQIQSILKAILQNLEFNHKNNILHRDIKPQNILFDQNFNIKLGDYGLAKKVFKGLNMPLSTGVVSLWYRAPELLLGSTNYDSKIDLWSVGCILGELILGYPMFHQSKQSNELIQLDVIYQVMGTPTFKSWPNVIQYPRYLEMKQYPFHHGINLSSFIHSDPDMLDLLESLLHLDPNGRLTAEEALEHTFFKRKY